MSGPMDEGQTSNHNLTLYDIERELAEALDEWHNDEAWATEEERSRELESVLAAYVEAAVEKRDKVAQFVAHLEAQSAEAAKEMERLALRRKRFDAKRGRLLAYLDNVMLMRGVKKLEGKHCVIKRKKCPPSLEIVDLEQVPAAFLTHEIKETWTPDKKRIKEELRMLREMGDENPQVDGTRLVDDRYRVVIE